MHNSKFYTDVVTQKHMWQGSNFSGCKFEQKSHKIYKIYNLQDLTAQNGSLDMWQPDMSRTYLKCTLIV